MSDLFICFIFVFVPLYHLVRMFRTLAVLLKLQTTNLLRLFHPQCKTVLNDSDELKTVFLFEIANNLFLLSDSCLVILLYVAGQCL